MSLPNPLKQDARFAEAQELRAKAAVLEASARDEYRKRFPQIGAEVKVKDRLRFGFNNLNVGLHTGTVARSWADQNELIVEFPSIPVKCGECGKTKGPEQARLHITEVDGW